MTSSFTANEASDAQTLIVKSIQNVDWEDDGFVKHLLSASCGEELSHLNKVVACTLWEFALHRCDLFWEKDLQRTVLAKLIGNAHMRASLAFVDLNGDAEAIRDGEVNVAWPPELLSQILLLTGNARTMTNTSSMANEAIGDKNVIAASIQNVDWDDEVFVKHLLSARGGKELSQLNKHIVDALWEFVLRHYGIWGGDNHRKVVDKLLDNDHMRQGLMFFCIHVFAKIVTDEAFDVDDWTSDLLSRIILTVGTTKAGKARYDGEGYSLLHHVAKFFSTRPNAPYIIRLIHNVIPNAMMHIHLYGERPLHTAVRRACGYTGNVQDGNFFLGRPQYENNEHFFLSIRALLEGNPTVAGRLCDGRFPFHEHCLSSPRVDGYFLDIAQDIYEANPLAIRVKIYSKTSRLQWFDYIMHGVCRRITYRHPVLPFLFERYPQGLIQKDEFGFVPFQVIESRIGAFTLLKEQFLDQIEQSDDLLAKFSNIRDKETGNNLLHVLAMRTDGESNYDPLNRFNLETTQQVFKWVLSKFPEYVTEKNAKGELPIHILLKNDDGQYTEEELTSLVSIYDKSCILNDEPNELNIRLDSNVEEDWQHPLLLAASRKKPRLSTIYFFEQRHVAQYGGFTFI